VYDVRCDVRPVDVSVRINTIAATVNKLINEFRYGADQRGYCLRPHTLLASDVSTKSVRTADVLLCSSDYETTRCVGCAFEWSGVVLNLEIDVKRFGIISVLLDLSGSHNAK